MMRLAKFEDIDYLNILIEESARALSQNDYSQDEIESAIRYVFGIDSELIEDKTYYVIEENKSIIACGGWSNRKTLFGGDVFSIRETGYINPKTDAAKIRAFFIHPQHARKGLGKLLLAYCEKEAFSCGFSNMELMATLPGARLYQACGYQTISEENCLLPNGISLKFLHMVKNIFLWKK